MDFRIFSLGLGFLSIKGSLFSGYRDAMLSVYFVYIPDKRNFLLEDTVRRTFDLGYFGSCKLVGNVLDLVLRYSQSNLDSPILLA